MSAPSLLRVVVVAEEGEGGKEGETGETAEAREKVGERGAPFGVEMEGRAAGAGEGEDWSGKVGGRADVRGGGVA